RRGANDARAQIILLQFLGLPSPARRDSRLRTRRQDNRPPPKYRYRRAIASSHFYSILSDLSPHLLVIHRPLFDERLHFLRRFQKGIRLNYFSLVRSTS